MTVDQHIRISEGMKNKLDGTQSKNYDVAIEKLMGVGEKTDTIPFKKEVASLTKETVTHIVPFTGQVSQVYIHFPSGCNSLVEVRLYSLDLDGEKDFIIPARDDEYIALDGVTQPFNDINFPVKKDSILKVDILNHDSVNPHTLTVMVVLKALPFI